MTSTRPVVLLSMRPGLPQHLFDAAARSALESVADIDWADLLHDPATVPARLAEADVLLTGWGSPRVGRELLALAPRLSAVIHAAGSVKGHLEPECWRRGLAVTSAADANAVPVAEYSLAMILLAGKRVFAADRAYRQDRVIPAPEQFGDVGNYGRTVGLVGASRVGRRLLEMLRPFDLAVLLHDPTISADEARTLGARRVGIEELVVESDVLSLHAPALPATHHMLNGRLLAMMRDGATVINTARGSLVDTDALVRELVSGRLHAVLDVTEPEPLPHESVLYELPNVILTPHLAGASGNELFRLGQWAVNETCRFLAGEPLRSPVSLADLERMA